MSLITRIEVMNVDLKAKVARSDANFMMVDIRRDAKQFKTDALKHDVAVGRQFPVLPNWVRVSVGTMPEMKKALGVFNALLA